MTAPRAASVFILSAATGVALLAGAYLLTLGGGLSLEKDHIWSIGIFDGASCFELAPAEGAVNPVLTGADVTDRTASFVADPFIVRAAAGWFMFFEIFDTATDQGDIAYASSPDGMKWTYGKVVIDESFHLSYPHVFQWEGSYYLIPESRRSGTLRLYRAVAFPDSWELAAVLAEGVNLSDPTPLRHDDRWWIFADANPGEDDTLALYWADDLLGPFRPHPRSPVVQGNADTARPGGRILVVDGRIYRFAMNCNDEMRAGGDRVSAVEIVRLTPTDYEESTSTALTVVRGSGKGWNRDRMHHVDAHPTGTGRWIAAVDGCKVTPVLRAGPFTIRLPFLYGG